MRKVWLVVLVTLWFMVVGFVVSAYAQTPFLGDVQTYRAQYPTPMSQAQITELLNRLAWLHRNEGWGLLKKPDGNNCPSPWSTPERISCDHLMHLPSLTHWDILKDQEGEGTPVWQDKGPMDRARYLSPVEPGTAPPPNTPPPSTPPPPAQVDEVLAKLRESRAEDSAQQERIYADVVNRFNALSAEHREQAISLARMELKLREMDERPTWLGRIFENKYVQYALVGVGTWLTQWQVTKEK